MTKTVLIPRPTDPKGWFTDHWNGSFSQEIQRILANCPGEIVEVGRAQEMVTSTFVHLRSHMQTQMQKIADASKGAPQNPKYLDRHKLGACVAGAFLHKGVFQRIRPNTETEWSTRAFFSNEILALRCAISTILAFLRINVKKNPHSIDKNSLKNIEEVGFSYPQSQDGLAYEFHLVRALRQCHIQHHCLPNLPTGGPSPPFDLFLFSTILFDIEHHSLKPFPTNTNGVESIDTNLAA